LEVHSQHEESKEVSPAPAPGRQTLFFGRFFKKYAKIPRIPFNLMAEDEDEDEVEDEDRTNDENYSPGFFEDFINDAVEVAQDEKGVPFFKRGEGAGKGTLVKPMMFPRKKLAPRTKDEDCEYYLRRCCNLFVGETFEDKMSSAREQMALVMKYSMENKQSGYKINGLENAAKVSSCSGPTTIWTAYILVLCGHKTPVL
jgi:hypothetical protein